MHVCKTLSQPNQQGIQTCLEWQLMSINSFLPSLTLQESATISSYILLVCVVAYCFKTVADFIKTHIKW